MDNNEFTRALYSGKDIPDVLSRYEKVLRNSENLVDVLHANKIAEYRKLITNRNLLYRIRLNFNEIYKIIDKNFPDLRFSIDGRRKSLISVEKKILKLLSENRSLDFIRDIFAFRVILFGDNCEELIQKCYDIANKIIEHSIKKGITICDAQFDVDAKNSIDIDKDESFIIREFESSIKDYIRFPKENGYQSIHMMFRATTGEFFEVQIRTFQMHLHAESGKAKHADYKKNKYSSYEISYDPKMVNIPGFGIAEDGTIFDMVGLDSSLEVLHIKKTY